MEIDFYQEMAPEHRLQENGRTFVLFYTKVHTNMIKLRNTFSKIIFLITQNYVSLTI